ncbi:MAG: excinuclease ABC subunit UvrA [Anaerolineae bacterium]|jgi:excinuclease ABC subunit A
MYQDRIVIRGARHHNLKGFDLELPRNRLIVFTGVSGSGKSSLAFDTLYAEGQRRYVQSLSAYARQFLGMMDKPEVDFIGGLSPTIAIEQKAVSKNPRSTVATVTEIYDYLRVLFARIGIPHCYQCGREVSAQTVQQMVDSAIERGLGKRMQVLAPVARNRKGTFADTFSALRAQGYSRVRIDGELTDLTEGMALDKNYRHNIEVVVDRVAVEESDEFRLRLTDSIETALGLSEGLLLLAFEDDTEVLLSQDYACPHCGISFPRLTPAMFSFNSPLGMCPDCSGLGYKTEFDPRKFVDDELSIHEGAVRPWGPLKDRRGWRYRVVTQLAQAFDADLNAPWKALPKGFRQALLYGSKDLRIRYEWKGDRGSGSGEWEYEGLIPSYQRRYAQTKSENMRRYYASFMGRHVCPTCEGKRLRPESAAVTIRGSSIADVTRMTVAGGIEWVRGLDLAGEEAEIGGEVLKEVELRLQFLLNVGLHYLSLDRLAPSLSGGEGQRIRLASQIGSGLVGVLYILDEPSIGLHQRDNRKLLDALEQLRDLGNSVIVVEHDLETMRAADYIVDLGPGAGLRGGYVVAAGTPEDIAANPHSLTGRYLTGELRVTSPNGRRPIGGNAITLRGVRHHNLKNLDVRFPLGNFICVTGVSGSGKSSLVSETLYPALNNRLHHARKREGRHSGIEGLEHVDKVINITQDPIGRTPRSNPATYVGGFDYIRKLFADLPESKARGYKPGRFSFNVRGGRCEECEGYGTKRVSMHFLPDVWVTCSACKGQRFNRETLQVRYKGKNIAEVLDMEVQEALEFFANHKPLVRVLETLRDVGMEYVKLGQPATTLSGGEAQRIKLAKELGRVATGRTVYILDEPTTGLHFADIQKLLNVLHRLVDAGNTVIVIEHNLDVIKTADYIVDLGPEGGDEGGNIVAAGSPEEVAQVEDSFTGRYLREILAEEQEASRWEELAPQGEAERVPLG